MIINKLNEIDTIVISGGGIRGIGFLGILDKLSEYKNLENIITYIGSSIGGIICFFLMIGYKPIDIFLFFFNIEETDINKIIEKSFNKFEEYKDISFKELNKITNKNLIITSYNIIELQSYYYDSNSDKNVLEELKETITIQFSFTKNVFIDG